MIAIPRQKLKGIYSPVIKTFQRLKLLPTPSDYLKQIRHNAVLKSKKEYEQAVHTLDYLGLPRHVDKPKNWDSLAALSLLLKYCPDRSARILDAGGESYSAILSQLEYCGYKDLTCVNLTFYGLADHLKKKGNITFEYGDIIETDYPAHSFDAITCQSVIEHGVDIDCYFKEMCRILRPGGILFTSTDYWEKPIDTKGKSAYGTPIRIFNAADIPLMTASADRYGFHTLAPLELACQEKTVSWTEFNLDYTFIYFTLQKRR